MMFKSNKKLNFYFLFFVILLIVGGLSVYSALKNPDVKKIVSQPEPQAAVKVEEKKFINRQGQEWGPLPSGDYKFMVSSGKDAIVKFIQGEIDPPDVHVGDLQKFKIIVTSPNGIAGVVAKIETDNGIKEVELKKTGVLAQADLSVNPIFTEDGVNYDIMNKDRFATSAKLQKERHVINTVDASVGENEVFEGNWTVVDTHNISYNTTFIATDKIGKTNQLVLAWSDLCGFTNGGSNYTLQLDCTISSGQEDGVDNGNLIIGTGYTLHISSGGALALNQGKSFSFVGSGAITIPATQPLGQIVKKYIYIEDGDQDGYAPAASHLTFSNTNSTGYVSESGYNAKRRYMITSGADCNDANANVKPSQLNWWSSAGTGWTPVGDYNCDATVNYAWAQNLSYTNYTTAQTTASPTLNSPIPTALCSTYNGTLFSATACGTTNGYSGSLFYVASGGACNGALSYWGNGPIISVCR